MCATAQTGPRPLLPPSIPSVCGCPSQLSPPPHESVSSGEILFGLRMAPCLLDTPPNKKAGPFPGKRILNSLEKRLFAEFPTAKKQ